MLNDTCVKFYILLTVHLDVILVNDQLDAFFLNVFISCLYMFRATSAHHQEDQVVLIPKIHLEMRTVKRGAELLMVSVKLTAT